MKYLITVLVLCLPKFGNSQGLFLIEDQVTADGTKVSALFIKTTNDFDEAIGNFKKYAKDEHDLKVKKDNSTTYMIEMVDLPHLSVKRGDLYTYLYKTDSANIMAFSFRLGYDISINSEEYPEEMAEFKKFITGYMEYHYHTHYMNLIDDQSKIMDQAVKELRQNENKISSLQKKASSLDKKYQKETDEDKKSEITSEKATLEREAEMLTQKLPEQRQNVSDLEDVISILKKELNGYHQEISSL